MGYESQDHLQGNASGTSLQNLFPRALYKQALSEWMNEEKEEEKYMACGVTENIPANNVWG